MFGSINALAYVGRPRLAKQWTLSGKIVKDGQRQTMHIPID